MSTLEIHRGPLIKDQTSEEKTATMIENGAGRESLSEERDIDWKKALVLGLATQAPSNIEVEKAWAKLTTHMRNLCPETNWSFIFQAGCDSSAEETLLFQNWLEQLVAKEDWPFPKELIIISEAPVNVRQWKILIPHSNKKHIPYYQTYGKLNITPYKDPYSGGWKVSIEEIYTVEQVGEA